MLKVRETRERLEVIVSLRKIILFICQSMCQNVCVRLFLRREAKKEFLEKIE